MKTEEHKVSAHCPQRPGEIDLDTTTTTSVRRRSPLSLCQQVFLSRSPAGPLLVVPPPGAASLFLCAVRLSPPSSWVVPFLDALVRSLPARSVWSAVWFLFSRPRCSDASSHRLLLKSLCVRLWCLPCWAPAAICRFQLEKFCRTSYTSHHLLLLFSICPLNLIIIQFAFSLQTHTTI